MVGLAFAGCASEEQVYKKGWATAIECVESHRSHEYCRESNRDDEAYLRGWNAAIQCMERTRNLRECQKPA